MKKASDDAAKKGSDLIYRTNEWKKETLFIYNSNNNTKDTAQWLLYVINTR